MAAILHLLTKKNDALAAEVIEQQRMDGHTLQILDLTVEAPDYDDVVKHIFKAESVQTW